MIYIPDFACKLINPVSKAGLENEIPDCIRQAELLLTRLPGKSEIVRLNWFFGGAYNVSYTDTLTLFEDFIAASKLRDLPLTVSQERPINNGSVQLVVCIINNIPDDFSFEFKRIDKRNYMILKGNGQRWMFMGGKAVKDREGTTRENAERSFSELKAIFDLEDMEFSQIVRQWNYIPGITGTEAGKQGKTIQKYQEFNDVRGVWYTKEGLEKDYPAATGIGVAGGSVDIELIALDAGNELAVMSLHNPEQSDAHTYSASKLVGEGDVQAPRFERGKIIFTGHEGWILVSGTAAIRGQDSIPGSIADQTNITLENIDRLVSPENLHRCGMPVTDSSVAANYIRAYVKNPEDGEYVLSRLNDKFPGAVNHVLEAEICRPELLVEIEGEFTVGTWDEG